MILKKSILLIICIVVGYFATAQVGIGTVLPHPSSALDLFSLSKGLLIPRLSLTNDLSNPNPVSNPAIGLLVFNLGGQSPLGFYYWSGTSWVRWSHGASEHVVSTGPSTDKAVARFYGTDGRMIQNSGVLISDEGDISGLNHTTTNAIRITNNPVDGFQLVSSPSGEGSWQAAPPVDVSRNDTMVLTNATVLNFNAGINVQSIEENEAKVTFFKRNVAQSIIQLSSPDSINLNTTEPVVIEWKTSHYKDEAMFIHSTESQPGKVFVRANGIYEVNFMIAAINYTTARQTIRLKLRKNSNEEIIYTTSYAFVYQNTAGELNQNSHSCSSFLVQLNENDYVEVISQQVFGSGTMKLKPFENSFFIQLVRKL